MDNEKLLTRKELEEEFDTIHIFVKGLDTKRSFRSQDFLVPNEGPVDLPLDMILFAKCWHTSPLWLNNVYTNYMS